MVQGALEQRACRILCLCLPHKRASSMFMCVCTETATTAAVVLVVVRLNGQANARFWVPFSTSCNSSPSCEESTHPQQMDQEPACIEEVVGTAAVEGMFEEVSEDQPRARDQSGNLASHGGSPALCCCSMKRPTSKQANFAALDLVSFLHLNMQNVG